MQIDKKKIESYQVFELQGKLLGGPEAQILMEEMQQLLDSGEKSVIFNLSGIERMNSSGLGVLIQVFTSFKNNGGVVKLAAAKENVRKLFEITKLDRIFEIYDSEAEALGRE